MNVYVCYYCYDSDCKESRHFALYQRRWLATPTGHAPREPQVVSHAVRPRPAIVVIYTCTSIPLWTIKCNIQLYSMYICSVP